MAALASRCVCTDFGLVNQGGPARVHLLPQREVTRGFPRRAIFPRRAPFRGGLEGLFSKLKGVHPLASRNSVGGLSCRGTSARASGALVVGTVAVSPRDATHTTSHLSSRESRYLISLPKCVVGRRIAIGGKTAHTSRKKHPRTICNSRALLRHKHASRR